MGYQILIVDDSEIIRSVVKKTISMSGIDVAQVFEAADGLEALAVMEKEWVDIVFADLNMPRMSGLDLVTHMAKDNMLQNTPVVIVSSERSELRIEELKQQGVRAYIKKPFRPEDFRDVVVDILGNREEGDE